MNYSIGDKVKIIQIGANDSQDTYQGEYDKYIGKVFTVIDIVEGMSYPYTLDIPDKLTTAWHDDELVRAISNNLIGGKLI